MPAVTDPSFFPFPARADEVRSRAEAARQKEPPRTAEVPAKRSRRRFDDIF